MEMLLLARIVAIFASMPMSEKSNTPSMRKAIQPSVRFVVLAGTIVVGQTREFSSSVFVGNNMGYSYLPGSSLLPDRRRIPD